MSDVLALPCPPAKLVAAALAFGLFGCVPTDSSSFRSGGTAFEELRVDTGEGEHDPVSWLHDYWTPTVELCEPPDPFVSPYTAERLYEEPCREALAADLKLDLEDFIQEVGGRPMWEVLVDDAFYLLGRDLGTVEQLSNLTDETDVWAIREPFIEQIRLVADELGHEDVRPALYNLVMSTILRTVYVPDLEYHATFVRSTRTMRWRGAGGYDLAAMVFVHEATHGWQDVGHVECPEGHVVNEVDYSGKRSCDEDWAGAYGFEAATARLFYNSVRTADPDSDTFTYWPEYRLDFASSMILAD